MRILLFFILMVPVQLFQSDLILNQTARKLVTKTLPSKQLKCLVDNAFYEARGEGHVGMLLVTQVVLNRAKQSNESYCRVVYKRNQFSWTVMKKLTKIPEDTRKEIEFLVLKVHHGFADHLVPMHLKSALFYHATYVKPYWSKKFDKLGYWGNHVFYH